MGCVADLRSSISNQICGFLLGRLLESKHGADAAVLELCRDLSASGFEEEARMLSQPKTCFVIMPFGEKIDVDQQVIDFDEVYQRTIKPAITALGVECIRCDDIGEAGSIHRDMFHHIFEDDIAVVDITTLNPNVFYELGVRHALKQSVTVLIRRKGTQVPFNIEGFRVIDYDVFTSDGDADAGARIQEFVRNGLQKQKIDSPVHAHLDKLRIGGDTKRLPDGEVYEYAIAGVAGKTLALITGDLTKIRGIDIWVNSENTNMQMARYYDRSVSSTIRYGGAKKDPLGFVIEDTIGLELAALKGHHESVPSAVVLSTSSGELRRTNAVKRVFHAASVIGTLGQGYVQVPNVADCVSKALDLASQESVPEDRLESILFQLMGAGTAQGDISTTAERLIAACISFLKTRPDCPVKRVYFHVTRETTLEICHSVLEQAGATLIEATP
jgi:hypothetical protein